MSKIKWFNLSLRALMETGIVLAFAFWGYQIGNSMGMKIFWAFIVPIVGFGIWGAIDFHQAGDMAEPLRLLEELIISGLAAFLLYNTGQHLLGLSLGLISIVYHFLVYISGGHLLKTA
jgi:hypothetical protein